jgi:hypothetical protein
MSLRILSVAPPLLSLFFFSAFVVAGINVTATVDLHRGFPLLGMHIVVPKLTTHFVTFLWPLSPMTLCPDVQLSLPKPVRSRCIHDGYMLLGV